MAFNPGDPVFACLPTTNDLPVDQTSTAERVHRDTIATAGQWNIGDTIKIKDATYVFFGFNDTSLTTKPVLTTSFGDDIACSVAAIGSGEVTITLSQVAPVGDTLAVGYRIGLASTYVELLQDRANDALNLHKTTINGGAKPFVEIYNKPHKYFGTNATVAQVVQADGMSIQTNPAT